jgi:hypothetical protein
MSVRVVGSNGDDGDPRTGGGEKVSGGGGPTPMVGDLEEVEMGDSARHEDGVDGLLGVAREEEELSTIVAKENDGQVVDPPTLVHWAGGDGDGIGPQDPQLHAVEGEPVARCQAPTREPGCCDRLLPGSVARTGAGDARLQNPTHPVAPHQTGQPAVVIFVGVTEEDDVEAAIPRREAAVEAFEEAVGVGSAVDEETPTVGSFQEDGISLADVEDRHPKDSWRSMGEGDAAGGQDHGDPQTRQTDERTHRLVRARRWKPLAAEPAG